MLGSKVYDFLKPVAQIWLPAAGTLYFTLAQTLGLPAAEEVVGTIVAVDAFLGTILGVSTAKFNNAENPAGKYDGQMIVSSTPETTTYTLALNDDPTILADRKDVSFKVVPAEPAHRA